MNNSSIYISMYMIREKCGRDREDEKEKKQRERDRYRNRVREMYYVSRGKKNGVNGIFYNLKGTLQEFWKIDMSLETFRLLACAISIRNSE